MPRHEYSPQQALEVLMMKLRARDELLSDQIQAAIDVGKDVSETEPSTDRRKKDRVYRKTVRFSHEEALQIALSALQAYFVEQPLFVASASDNLAQATVGVPTLQRFRHQSHNEDSEPVSLKGQGEEKTIVIETQTETQLSKTAEETVPLKRVAKEQIEEQRHNIKNLREMTDFSED